MQNPHPTETTLLAESHHWSLTAWPQSLRTPSMASQDTWGSCPSEVPGHWLHQSYIVLVGVNAPLRGDHVLLTRVGAPGVDVTVLEHNSWIAKDEVHRACNVALHEELAIGVDVKGVLVRMLRSRTSRRLRGQIQLEGPPLVPLRDLLSSGTICLGPRLRHPLWLQPCRIIMEK